MALVLLRLDIFRGRHPRWRDRYDLWIGGLPIVPFGPVGKLAPALSYLKVRFLSHLILRGLGQGFGCLRFAAILFGEGHGSITLPFARQITLHRQARHPSEDEDRQHRQEDVRPLETARKAAPGRPEGTGSAFPAAAGTFPSPSCETRVLLPARKSGAVRI
jgi:hypothetical protein